MKEIKQEIVEWREELRMKAEDFANADYMASEESGQQSDAEYCYEQIEKMVERVEAQAVERTREETLREVTKKIKARLVEVPIPPQDEDWGINLTRTEIFNNGVLEARIAVLATLTAQLKGDEN